MGSKWEMKAWLDEIEECLLPNRKRPHGWGKEVKKQFLETMWSVKGDDEVSANTQLGEETMIYFKIKLA
jgi:hypothetical protein